MKIYFSPKNCFGKWSVGLMIAFFAFFGLFFLFVIFGNKGGGDTFFSNIKLAISALLAGFSALLSLFFGFVSIIRYRERSVLVFIAIIIGFFVMIFTLGELLFPH